MAKSPEVLRTANGWSMQHYDLYPLLGYKSGGHIPEDEDRHVEVQGKSLHIRPSRNGKHRIFQNCSKCQRWIPFGRMQQHVTRRDHR